jgi:hypothetical protein
MDAGKIFVEDCTKLAELPSKPKIFWYVSAGHDFRGPVFLTQNHIDFEEKHYGKKLQKPDLFVYNCMGQEVQELKDKLSEGGRVELFNDLGTKIVGDNFEILKLNNSINFQVDPLFIDVENVQKYSSHREAFYFELEIINRNYREKQKVLYFEAENIDFFDKIILADFFETLYLCATKEGCGFGNCKKSIIDFIYNDSTSLFYSDFGFKPTYNILYTDFTHKIFQKSIAESKILTAKEDYVNYIQENQEYLDLVDQPFPNRDSIVYSLDYLELMS